MHPPRRLTKGPPDSGSNQAFVAELPASGQPPTPGFEDRQQLQQVVRGKSANPKKISVTPLNIGMTEKDWKIESIGEGRIEFTPQGILMTPREAVRADETHASLLLAAATQKTPLRNFKVTVTFTNQKQLRQGDKPNDWEVFWLFFNYRLGSDGKKEANYVTIKPNGVEIGKAFGEIGQEFFSHRNIGPKPAIKIGTGPESTYTMTLVKKGPRIEVALNGKIVADYESKAAPKDLYDVPGMIGIYSEDCQVLVSKMVLEPLP